MKSLIEGLKNDQGSNAYMLLRRVVKTKTPNTMKNKLGSLLLDATKKGHAMAISNLLAVGASVNFTGSGSESAAIHLAASEGHDSAAIVLLGGGAKIELKNVFDLTPLYCAAGAGRLGMMKLLLSHGAWRAEEGLSLEEFAAGSGHIDVIRWLLHEVDPDTRERLFDIYNRKVAIDMALLEGYNDIVAEILKPHLDFWEEDRWGFNTFCFAAIGGNESTIKKLLDLISPPEVDNQNYDKYIQLARIYGNNSALELFTKLGEAAKAPNECYRGGENLLPGPDWFNTVAPRSRKE